MVGRLTCDRDECMERVTLRLPEAQLERIDDAVADGAFADRSKAIRAAIGHSFGGELQS